MVRGIRTHERVWSRLSDDQWRSSGIGIGSVGHETAQSEAARAMEEERRLALKAAIGVKG